MMFKRFFLLGLLALFLSCKKEKHPLQDNPTAIVLLTQKPWTLASHGFDDNNNGKIDPDEERIEDCQRDNIIHFYVDGSGLFDDNGLSCATGIEKQSFSWAFAGNETSLDFFHYSAKIFRLNDRELVIYKEMVFSNNQKIKFILTYTH